MNDYTIYCTEEQTKKALELGAPIKRALYPSTWFEEVYPKRCHIDIPENPNGCTLAIPTSEQMINWLDFKGVLCEIYYRGKWYYDVQGFNNNRSFNSRKEAILDAIDTALEYLISKKGEIRHGKYF